MTLTSRTRILAAIIAVAFTISGCQTSGKWATAWKDRSKPKTEFKDPNNTEQVSYWPYKTVKDKPKFGPVPSQLQDKMAQRSAQSKHDSQLKELLAEGDVLRNKNQLQQAQQVYEKALALAPNDADVHRRLAIVADLQGNFALADEHYQATLRIRPRDVDVLSDKGYSYMLRGNNPQAELVLREALLIDPSHKLAMANLAEIYRQQNRYTEALAMFRAGGTEAEAQKNIAIFFPQASNLAMVSGTQDPASKVSPAVGSAVAESQPDLTKLDIKQIQAEMARRRLEGQQRRYEADQRELEKMRRAATVDDEFDPQVAAQQPLATQQGTTRDNFPSGVTLIGPRGRDKVALNSPSGSDGFRQQGITLQPGLNGTQQDMGAQVGTPAMNPRFQPQDNSMAQAPNRETAIFRGPPSASQPGMQADPRFQQGWNPQASGRPANSIQQTNELTSRQIATQLGMNAGPGSLFPAPQPGGNSGFPPNGFDNRFGSEFSPAPASQNPQNWPGNPDMQRRGNNEPSADDGLSTNPPSPANNWGTPSMTTGPNWQNGLSESSDWSNEFQSGNSRSSGFDQQGVQSAWGQNDGRRSANRFDNGSQGMTSPNRNRNGNDASRSYNNDAARPYNGAWPNSNSIPARQNQVAPDNGSRFDLSDQFGGGPINAGGTANSGNQNGLGNGSGNSLPMWPSAPNR